MVEGIVDFVVLRGMIVVKSFNFLFLLHELVISVEDWPLCRFLGDVRFFAVDVLDDELGGDCFFDFELQFLLILIFKPDLVLIGGADGF